MMTGLSQEYVHLISHFDLLDFRRSLLRAVWIPLCPNGIGVVG